MSEGLVRMLSDQDLATVLTKAGREKVAREFSFSAMIERYFSSYDQILAGIPASQIK